MNFSQPDWRCQGFHAAMGTGVQREPSPPHPLTLGPTERPAEHGALVLNAGGIPAPWREAKTVTTPATRKRRPNTSAHGIRYQPPRKTQDCAAVSDTALSLREKKDRKQNPLQWFGWVLAAAKASRCPGSDAGELAHAHPILKGPWPHSCGVWNTEAEGIPYRLKRNKETLIESETGNENPT